MKFNFILPVLICSTLLIGCKNPFEAKNKGMEQLDSIEQRWIDMSTLISSTSRIALGVVSGNGKYSTLRIFTPTSFNDIQHGIFA